MFQYSACAISRSADATFRSEGGENSRVLNAKPRFRKIDIFGASKIPFRDHDPMAPCIPIEIARQCRQTEELWNRRGESAVSICRESEKGTFFKKIILLPKPLLAKKVEVTRVRGALPVYRAGLLYRKLKSFHSPLKKFLDAPYSRKRQKNACCSIMVHTPPL